MTPTHTSEEYSKHDHMHCWESNNPPCGQKIKHFECCLCKEFNEEIKKNIGMLRQWLNEDRIDDPKKMVTNEQIEKWLEITK